MLRSHTASEGRPRKDFGRSQALLGIALAFLGLLWLAASVSAQSEIEYRVKAAFLFNFARFTTWPPTEPAAGPFVIGCFSDPEFMQVLEATVAGKTLGTRAIMVKRVTAADDLRECQLLFVGHAQDDKALALLQRAIEAHVLTVGESDDFNIRGGMIQLVTAGGGVKFAINQRRAERAGLKISSKLLELALNDPPGGG